MNRKRAILIATGTAVLVGGAAVVHLVNGVHAESGYCALMADSVGLYEGNPVTQMGYRVGSIDRIDDAGDHVEVSFTLDGDRKYPAGVKAVTRSKSVLADRNLELIGNYDAGPELVPGSCIALQNTATPRSLSEIAGSAADLIDQVSPEGEQSVATAVDRLARALEGNGDKAHQLMLNAAEAMANPDPLVSDLGSILQNSAPLTNDALENWSTVHGIMDLLPGVATALAHDGWPGVKDTINGLGPVVALLYEIQVQYGADIWPLVGGVSDLLHFAATHAEDISNFLEVIPTVSAFVRNTSTETGTAAVQFKPPTVEATLPGGQRLVGTNLFDLLLQRSGS